MRLGLHNRLTLVVTAVAVVTLAGLTVGFNLVLRTNLDGDANNILRARAFAALGTTVVRDGKVTLKEAPDQHASEVPLWVYDGSHAIEHPSEPASVQRIADSLAARGQGFAEDPSTETRLYAAPITRSGTPVGTVVTAVSLEPYERTASRALVGSLIFSVAVLALIIVATRWVTGRALRPVSRMTSEALAWSERDLDHRFNAGEPQDEITALAAAFDRMLDLLAASLRHEQRFTAEISHELRTPLTAILAEADLALRRPRTSEDYRRALESITSRAHQLQRTMETLLLAASAEAGQPLGTADAVTVAENVLDLHREEAAARGVSLDGASGNGVHPRLGTDGDLAERVLSPIVENAARHARSRVEVSLESDQHTVTFVVDDDGTGVAAEDRERLFEPGYRGPESGSGESGAGLGLSLARRLARAVDGDVEWRPRANGGARFAARLPRA